LEQFKRKGRLLARDSEALTTSESAMRTLREKYSYDPPNVKRMDRRRANEPESRPEPVLDLENDSDPEEVQYPLTAAQRAAYRTRLGKVRCMLTTVDVYPDPKINNISA
jgi:hypothetical protein